MPKGSWREFDNGYFNNNQDQVSNNAIANKANRSIRVQRTRSGKSGKTVTMIRGLSLNGSDLKKLLKVLKTKCGTGGTVKDEIIELQGDQIKSATDCLVQEGFLLQKKGG